MIKGACWHIAVRQKASGSILSDKTTPFEVKSNPLCGCLMDPLIFEWKGNSYVFAEFFNYFTQRGEIAYCVLKDGKCSKWKTILREKFHLSYPCVFSVNDQIYMIPETSKCDKVLLYKFVHFPDVIEKVSEIKNGCEFVDTTVIKKGKNESFLYTYDLKTKRLLFYKLMSHCVEDWRFNDPDFIVSSRQDQIRPGGGTFYHESRLIGVSQDCQEEYGRALIFNDIDCASFEYPYVFSETIVDLVEPKDLHFISKGQLDCRGIHTYSSTATYEIIDIKGRSFNLIDFSVRLFKRYISRN